MFRLDENMSYLIGAIIGDGHLFKGNKSAKSSSKDYRISIESTEKSFMAEIERIFIELTATKSRLRIIRQKGRKARFGLMIRHKQLFLFLHEQADIPIGKKSACVDIPTRIKKAKKNIILLSCRIFRCRWWTERKYNWLDICKQKDH